MILVTGAGGFVGTALRGRLDSQSAGVRAVSRQAAAGCLPMGAIGAETDWSRVLEGVDCVVHLAARVHVMRDTERDPLTAFRAANVESTINLARQAARLGVRRFVFISSIKVNGEESGAQAPFRPEDPPAPMDPYGVSKREAEDALLRLAVDANMDVVIVRPPLVYGPGVKGNFREMMRWLKRGLPLPLGAIDNRRTLLALDNLVDLIVTCLVHSAAANQVFLAGDGEDMSTTDLLRRLAAALGVPAKLFPVPPSVLQRAAALVGKRDVAQRLCANLQVDISKARQLLGWTPPVTVDEGLRRAAVHFLEAQRQ